MTEDDIIVEQIIAGIVCGLAWAFAVMVVLHLGGAM